MLKRFLPLLFLISLATGLSGCYHQQVIVDTNYNASKSMPDYQSTYFHILGLFGISNDVTLNEVCPNGAGVVENKTLITINVLTIEQLAVYCKN